MAPSIFDRNIHLVTAGTGIERTNNDANLLQLEGVLPGLEVGNIVQATIKEAPAELSNDMIDIVASEPEEPAILAAEDLAPEDLDPELDFDLDGGLVMLPAEIEEDLSSPEASPKLSEAECLEILAEQVRLKYNLARYRKEAPEGPIGVYTDENGRRYLATSQGEVCGITSRGIKAREVNEDGFFFHKMSDKKLVLGVFDGLGGHGYGEVATEIGVLETAHMLRRGVELTQAINSLNYCLERMHQKYKCGSGEMGACFAGAVISGDTVRFTHIGDVRAALIRDGKVIYSTRDHSSEQELLDYLGLESFPENYKRRSHYVTSTIVLRGGLVPEDGADVSEQSPELELESGDFVVIASDGMWDNLSLKETGDISEWQDDARLLSAELFGATESQIEFQKGKDDNITIVVYRHN